SVMGLLNVELPLEVREPDKSMLEVFTKFTPAIFKVPELPTVIPDELPRPAALLILNVPALTVVAPKYVFAPFNVKVPTFDFVNPPVPLNPLKLEEPELLMV